MTENKPEHEAPTSPAPETVDDRTQQDPEQSSVEPETSADDADRLATLEAENADLKDRVLRAMADMENLRRRKDKEIKDAGQYSVAGFARDMLGVSDNLRRALDALPADIAEQADETWKTLLEGVAMTEREMLNGLSKHGVSKLEPEGQKFDPNFHQAMFEVPDPSVPNGTVVQVVQAGFKIGDRVLRPAMVGVAKGGPKPAKAPPAPPEADTAPETDGPADSDGSAGAHVDKTA